MKLAIKKFQYYQTDLDEFLKNNRIYSITPLITRDTIGFTDGGFQDHVAQYIVIYHIEDTV